MSQENVELVRQLIALGEQASESGLTSPPLDLVAPDIEIDLSRRVFNPATYRGFDGWLRLNDELREVWAGWQVTPERIIAVGDRVVSIENVCGRGRGSGGEAEARYASLWTLADGGVTRVGSGRDADEAVRGVAMGEKAR